MIKSLFVAALFLACASPGVAATERPQKAVTKPDAQVDAFLKALVAGNGSAGVQALMSASPLWSKHPGSSEQLSGQIDAAMKAYGPVLSFEELSTAELGSMAKREYFLVQHRDMVTRWEFDLVRTPSGWNVAYLGFTDQPNTWF
jgi:hypothetical protein